MEIHMVSLERGPKLFSRDTGSQTCMGIQDHLGDAFRHRAPTLSRGF